MSGEKILTILPRTTEFTEFFFLSTSVVTSVVTSVDTSVVVTTGAGGSVIRGFRSDVRSSGAITVSIRTRMDQS